MNDILGPSGPVRPPSSMKPKSFVLMNYAVGAMLVVFFVIWFAPGWWKLAAAVPALPAAWLCAKYVRASREVFDDAS